MRERKELRREREKHFENADHSFTAAIYGQPVHFMENGEWTEIDNTVELAADGRYENRKNDFKVSFAGSASDEELITVTKDDHSLSWKMKDALKVAVRPGKKPEHKKKKDDMEVTGLHAGMAYKNVLDGVDLAYELRSKTLKENIVLNKPPVEGKIVFEIATDLVPEADGRRILFKADSGEDVFVMAAPFMFDADGKESHAIEVMCEGKRESGRFVYTLIPDEAWLTAPERKWPVTIDPVITTSTERTSIEDTRISSRYCNTNFQNSERLYTGRSSNAGICRSLVNFELPQLSPADMVIGAILNLVCYSSYNDENQVHVHRILDAWDADSVTWNTMPRYDSKVEDCAMFMDTAGASVQFNITGLVKEWYNSGGRYGVLVKDAAEDTGYAEFFAEDSDITYEALRPKVYISYVNYTGVQDFWTYHSQDVRRAGQVHVNDYNGNLIYQHSIDAVSGNRMPYALELVYNSNDKDTDMGYGKGFRLNYHQQMESVTIDDVLYYKWTDGTGTRHYFKLDSEKNQWLDELNKDLELVIGTASDAKYTICSKQEDKLVFDLGGRLVKITDMNGNGITLGYDDSNRLCSVTDGAGRVISVSYTGSTGIAFTNPAAQTKTLTLSGGKLLSIRDFDEKVTDLAYTDGLLTAITNFDGYKMMYAYTGTPARVKNIREYTGTTLQRTLDIEYGWNINKYTDERGRSETYLFNHAGHTVSVKNDEGYAQITERMEAGASVNKLSRVSKLQRTVPQLAKDPNILSSDDWSGGMINKDPEYARTGGRSLKLVTESYENYARCSQYVCLEPGHTYTFSGYILTDGSLQHTAGGGAILGIGCPVADGDRVEFIGPSGIYDTQGEWRYAEYTFTIPEDAFSGDTVLWPTLDGCIGTAYFDGLQLEEGSVGSRRNLVENNDFTNGLDAFTRSSTMEDRDNLVDITGLTSDVVEGTDNSLICGEVNADVLNVRSGPGTGYSRSHQLKTGHMVVVRETTVGDDMDWYRIEFNLDGSDGYGYVAAEYITLYPSGSRMGKVNADSLNVRAGAGTGYTAVTSIGNGCYVRILGEAAGSGMDWYHIDVLDGSTSYTGYVAAEYIIEITTSPLNGPVDMEAVTAHTGMLNTTVMRMVGDPEKEKRLSQTISISGKVGDAFVISGWGCGNPLPMDQAAEGEEQRRFGVELEFTYTDGTTEAFNGDFASDSNQWQYVNKAVVASKDYNSIKASYVYNYNANKVYFDGLSVFKDEYWPSFTYDEDGNVISCTDAREQKTTFGYDTNNNITKITTPAGADFDYTYDDRHQITGAVTATGKKYSFEYDGMGNLTSFDGVTYTWTRGRKLASVTKAEGTEITYEYDLHGRRVKKTVGNEIRLFSYVGDRLFYASSSVGPMYFSYDSVGNPVAVMYNNVEYYYVKNV